MTEKVVQIGLAKTKRKLLLSIIATVLSIAAVVGFVFAWFLPYVNSNEFLTYVGDINLECEIYIYKESLTEEQQLDFGDATRSQIIADNYFSISDAKERNKLLNADGSETFENIYIGKQLRYKIVIKNNNEGGGRASIDISFKNMTDYFKECVDLQLQGDAEEEIREIFGNNSSRLLFNVKALKMALYSTEDDNSNFDILVENSEQYILPQGQYLPLWRYSRGEAFGEKLAEGIVLEHGNLLEIDLTLSCDFFTEEINQYNANAQDLYKYLFVGAGETLSADVATAINEIANQESLYIFGDEADKLEFTIKGIIIRGTQLP